MGTTSELGQAEAGSFRTTHWSVVLAASQKESPRSQQALAKLCQVYWYPLCIYVQRRGYDFHQAQDLTQEFFRRLLEKDLLAGITQEGGKFRSFLLTALKRFLANEWARSQTQKRGGGKTIFSLDAAQAESGGVSEPADAFSPDLAFEQQWAKTLLNQVMCRLEAEYKNWRKTELFYHLQGFLSSKQEVPHAELGLRLGMSPGAVKTAVYRIRTRYQQLLIDEISRTVGTPEEVKEEIRYLINILSR